MKKLLILSLVAISASQSIANYNGYGGPICKVLNNSKSALSQLAHFFDDNDPRSQGVEQAIQIVDKVTEETIKTSHNKNVVAKNKAERQKHKEHRAQKKNVNNLKSN